MSLRNEEFEDLALRVLAREASPQEKTAFETALAQDPARRAEFDQFRETMALAKAALPMTAAMNPQAAELPAYRINELRSAVRTHFKANQKSTEIESGVLFGKLVIRFLLGGGLVAACALLVLLAMPGPGGIEVGVYAEPLARTTDNAPLIQSTGPVHVNQFENDKSFEQWLAQPFEKNEKVRVWIDEEHDLIHARFAPTFFTPAREITRPLPDAASARRVAIESLIAEIQK